MNPVRGAAAELQLPQAGLVQGRRGRRAPGGLRIHDLRHTCASLLISAGANPKAVRVHRGHSSIAVTMDRYTHLFPSDTEALIGRLDDVRSRALAEPPRPSHGPRVIGLDQT